MAHKVAAINQLTVSAIDWLRVPAIEWLKVAAIIWAQSCRCRFLAINLLSKLLSSVWSMSFVYRLQ
jgi:hypothetical protein